MCARRAACARAPRSADDVGFCCGRNTHPQHTTLSLSLLISLDPITCLTQNPVRADVLISSAPLFFRFCFFDLFLWCPVVWMRTAFILRQQQKNTEGAWPFCVCAYGAAGRVLCAPPPLAPPPSLPPGLLGNPGRWHRAPHDLFWFALLFSAFLLLARRDFPRSCSLCVIRDQHQRPLLGRVGGKHQRGQRWSALARCALSDCLSGWVFCLCEI